MAAFNALKITSSCIDAVTKHTGIGICSVVRSLHGSLKQSPKDALSKCTIPWMKLPQYDHCIKTQIEVKSNNAKHVLTSNLQLFKPLQIFPYPILKQSTKINNFELEYDTGTNTPLEHLIVPIEEPATTNNFPLEAAKSDIKWRRRRMRRHKLLRWRKKYPQLVAARLRRKLQNRADKQQEALEKSWKMHGLTEEPPKLSEEEKAKLQQQWREEGVWTDPLKIEEHANYAKIVSIMKQTDKP